MSVAKEMPLTKPGLQKHIHKLKRHRYPSGNTVFFCVLDCTYKIDTALSVGKKALCWRCGREFIMDEYSLRLAKPHCSECHQPKKKVSISIQIPEQESFTMPSLKTEASDSLQSLRDRLNQASKGSTETFEEDEDI